MPPDSAPTVRIDREWLNGVELDATEAMLYAIWDIVDALTLTKAIYTQLVLPPNEAEAKRQAQMGDQ